MVTTVIVGPTAVGKSALAMALARRCRSAGADAEIVNADSMLVYRGMDIGTAKPTVAEQGGVVHHLVDIWDFRQTATVANFQALARTAIADCEHRGAIPIVVGGSALYVRAVVDDFQFPGTDPAVRGGLEQELAELGPERLHDRLRELDPAAAERIEPANGRRTVRALEVIALTGAPYAASLPEHDYLLPGVVQLGLTIDRPALDARIEARVAGMWAAGLVAEVRELAEHGLRDGVTASRALGYRQVLAYLDGRIDEAQAQAETVTGTRKFARRQYSWYRRDPRIHWLSYDQPDLVEAAYALAGPDGTGVSDATRAGSELTD